MGGFIADLCVVKHISRKCSKIDIWCQQCRQKSEAVNSLNLLQDRKGRSGSADKSQGLPENPSQMSQAINLQRGRLRIILSGVSCSVMSYFCCGVSPPCRHSGAEPILVGRQQLARTRDEALQVPSARLQHTQIQGASPEDATSLTIVECKMFLKQKRRADLVSVKSCYD